VIDLRRIFIYTYPIMIKISENIIIPEREIVISTIRSSGPGGQNVNKVSTAVHLRFDIHASSLPDFLKDRLLGLKDTRITAGGIVVIKSKRHRSQMKNRAEALGRLETLLRHAQKKKNKRKATRPSENAIRKRLEQKVRHGRIKESRKKVSDDL
jgi:ribosome-associated protein